MSPSTITGIPYGPAPKAAAIASWLAWPPKMIVIHSTANTASAANEANYAATRSDSQSNWTSAHAYVDTAGPLGSCPLTKQAWAAYSYANQFGLHLEMCGHIAGHAQAVPSATIALTARLTAQLCDLAGIPKVKLSPADVAAGRAGICGHWDITQGLHAGDHNDPGPSFDWSSFIRMVNQLEDDMTPDEHQMLADTYTWARAACTGRDTAGNPFSDPWDGTPVNGVRMLSLIAAELAAIRADLAASRSAPTQGRRGDEANERQRA